MKSILTTFILLFLIHAIGLGGGIKGDISPIFDLSPDGKKIVISISDEGISHLYEYSFKDKSLTQLTDNENEYHSRPVYSPMGDKIMFLSKSLKNYQSDICLFDMASKTITKLTKIETYVTEATFSPTGDKIIYCGSGYLGSYSPISRKAPHDLDLFSIKTDGTDFKQITNLSAYELSSISLSQTGDTVLCKLTEKGFAGIYLMSLIDTTILQKIEAINNPRPQIGNSFYCPMYAPNFKSISFAAPYQLYTLDLDNMECQEVWSTLGSSKNLAMTIFSRFFKKGNKLIFSILKIKNRQYESSAGLLIVDLKTKKTTEIKIQ